MSFFPLDNRNMSLKKDKFFQKEVKKEESTLKKKFSFANIIRKFSEPINLTSIPESVDEAPQIKKKFSLSNIIKDGFGDKKPSSLIPPKDDDLFENPNFGIKRKNSLSSLLSPSPRVKEIPVFTNRKMSSPMTPREKTEFNSPRNTERPHFITEKHKNMNMASSLPVLDYEKTKKLEENYSKLTFEDIVKEERQRFQQKNEFSPWLILRCTEESFLKEKKQSLDDNEWENAVKVVHIED